MTRATDPIDDDLRLHAWVDGQLPPEQHAEVEAYLRDHPEAAARVREWAADRDTLQAGLEPMLHESVPVRLQQLVWAHAPADAATGWLRMAAALALLVAGGVVGALLAWQLQALQPRTADAAGASELPQRAAVAHAVYAPERRHPVEVTAAESAAEDGHLARWLTRRLEVPVRLFDLSAQGFELVGGRLLPDEHGPSAQLMYQDAAGRRVTVYLRKPPAATPAAFRFERLGELGVFYWVEGEAGYALVGTLPRAQLLALAQAIYQQGAPAGQAQAPAKR